MAREGRDVGDIQWACNRDKQQICLSLAVGGPSLELGGFLCLVARQEDSDPNLGEFIVYTKWDQLARGYEDVLRCEVHVSPRSEACLALAARWVHECRSKHRKCKRSHSDQPMPTRVLDVGNAGSESIRLLETNHKIGAWAALSYCWGGSSEFTLTTATLRERLDGVALHKFPTTFRDAIFVTRRLSIRYLWIDALCIVQDDPYDWAREAGRMKDVYSGSAVTILATNSTNVHHGFLRYRKIPGRSFPLEWKPGIGRAAVPVFLRPWDALKPPEGPLQVPKSSQTRPEGTSPLNSRGWALQEYLLSPRTLSYGEQQMTWECSEVLIAEEGHILHYRSWRRLLQSMMTDRKNRKLTEWELSAGYEAWKTIVEDYTHRSLTFATDILPALSGIAGLFESYLADRYCAGLWAGDIIRELMWRVPQAFIEPLGTSLPPEHATPSWSWASLGGLPVEFLQEHFVPSSRIKEAKLLGITTEPISSDRHGRAIGGSLEMWAFFHTIRDVTSPPDCDSESHLEDLVFALSESAAFKVEFERQHRYHSNQTFAVLVLSMFSDRTILLIVESTGRTDGEYRRIGIFDSEPCEDSDVNFWPSGAGMTAEIERQRWGKKNIRLV